MIGLKNPCDIVTIDYLSILVKSINDSCVLTNK